ncbi:MAG TPA: flagellar filament capping protein FliD [Actinomycetales bacterium]|nr:flagellar filament capping protein FliD [Actinomycetales bacterium]
MATFSVDGMISGLDTSTIISQLMQIEAQPQARLKSSVTQAQSTVTAYQSINTRLLAISTAADNLKKDAAWTAGTATASNDAVSVTTGDSPLPGSLTFSVSRLATAKSVASQEFTSTTDASSLTGFPLKIVKADGTSVSITPSEGSLDAVATAINKAAGAGVQAAVVQVSPGHYRLQITSTATGTAGDFTVQDDSGNAFPGLSLTTVSDAQDALVHVGPATGGYDVTSSSNTIEGLMPGVTVKLQKTTDAVTVTTAADPNATVNAVQSLVDAANNALAEIKKQTSAGTANPDGTRTGQGVLAGNGLMRDLSAQIISAVSNAVGTSSSGSIGISVTRDGTLSLDKDKLLQVLQDDPAGARAVLAPTDEGGIGVVQRLSDLTTRTTRSGDGLITLAIEGQNSLIKDLNDRIADWDVRLQQRQDTLKRTYSALEVSLSQLKSQSSWLAGQLNGLSSSGS